MAIARWLLVVAVVALMVSPPLTNTCEFLVVLLVLFSRDLRQRLWATLRQPMALAALAFFLVLAIAITYSAAPAHEGLVALGSWRKLLFLPIAMSLFDEPAAKRQMAAGLVAAASLLAVVSFVSFGLDIRFFPNDFAGIVARNHGTQGMLFAAAAFAAACLATEPRAGRWRAALLAAAAFLALNVVVVGQARSGYLVLLACMALFAWNSAWFGRTGTAGKLAATAAAVLLTAGALVASPQSRDRVQEALNEALNYDTHTTVTSMGMRPIFWINTVSLIEQRPVFGWGTASFEHVYLTTIVGRTGVAATPAADPHNQFMKIAAEQGVVGLAVFLALLAASLRQPASAPWRLLGLGVLASWCLTSMASSHFSTFAEGTFLYMWVGAMLAREREGAPAG
ncbi:O-antigen ligase family protein [Ramlibacter sp. USB13]|uniref:O-antigen ligase family protein n=1 Tax=Ramlibacter cellulosilyticus TaxID=2764187 RepID=A0A923MX58_9BURK|nr:O-antigen ligase family protein [Ramlibacter cellulosilyticus]